MSRPINVMLTIQNLNLVEDNGFVLMNEAELSRNITITATGKTSRLNELSSQNIIAYIDLRPIDYTYERNLGVSQAVNVYTNFISDVQLTPRPRTVDIILDRTVSENKRVIADIIEPENETFVPMDAVLSPETITVTGPRSIVETINVVSVRIDLRDAEDDVITSIEPRVFDGNNRIITSEVDLNVNEISVKVPIYMNAVIPLRAQTSGNPASDFRLTELRYDIGQVEVIGPREEIENNPSLYLPPINVAGRTQNISETFNLQEILSNTRLNVKYCTADEVTITAMIERLVTRSFEVPFEEITVIGLKPGVTMNEMPIINLTVRGLRDRIEPLTADDLTGIINLSHLTIGTHEVPVLFRLPYGIERVGAEPTIVVEISEFNANNMEDGYSYDDDEDDDFEYDDDDDDVIHHLMTDDEQEGGTA
jgi:YbbR domain-containing protein